MKKGTGLQRSRLTASTRATVGWYNGENRMWLYFDLRTIPVDAHILSAVVRLWQERSVGLPDRHRYDLSLVRKSIIPEQLSWKGPTRESTWTQGGGGAYEGDSPDRSLPVATILCPGNGGVWRQWEVAESIQTALRNNQYYGFFLVDRDVKQNDPQNTSIFFTVPESATVEHRPVLAIRYSDQETPRAPEKSMRLPEPPTDPFQSVVKFRDGQLPYGGYRLTHCALISSGAPYTNSLSLPDRLVIGHPESVLETRALLRFGGIEPARFTIRKAWLELHAPVQAQASRLQIGRMTATWRGTEVSWMESAWGRAWKTPGADSTELRLPTAVIPQKDVLVLRYDVTDWVTEWHSQPAENHGVLLRLPDKTIRIYADNAAAEYLRPMLTVVYGGK